MNSMEIADKLKAATDRFVRLVNEEDVDSKFGGTRIHVHGKLRAPDEADGEWVLFVGESPGGWSVVGFPRDRVIGVFTQPSGTVEITLK